MTTEKKIDEMESRLAEIEIGLKEQGRENRKWIREFLINELKGFRHYQDVLGFEASLGIEGLISILRNGRFQEELL